MDLTKLTSVQVTYITLSLFLIVKNAAAINCFQCQSTDERTCAEELPQHHVLYADPCEHIQGAQYCVKMTGLVEACGLKCYQCDGSSDAYCPERMKGRHHPVGALSPDSCDWVFEARYCVKTTGLFEGMLGTKRFCSARDWGNYCEWVRRPGDEREYRACVFTCWGDGCNSAPSLTSPPLLLLLLLPVATLASRVML
ncbi:hypothetical protein GWK47_042385 [Chionoecetes opilio]|uniref:Protein quiver n=1 Tax=Chionoecetes opilio TaxID=41210 RepID=A0A8J4YHA8_CHIOP|nr:hypothetical protein GWK47_042385 [Chionoecetes opilio]